MPRISEFYGIIIEMFHADHAPPHFHAKYGDQSALVALDPIRIDRGKLPPRAQRMVVEWASLHHRELLENWGRTERFESLVRIDPLP